MICFFENLITQKYIKFYTGEWGKQNPVPAPERRVAPSDADHEHGTEKFVYLKINKFPSSVFMDCLMSG